MFWVYILQSTTTRRYYIGHTSNLGQRIAEHNLGKNLSTRHWGPFKLVYTEKLNTKSEVMKRETKIKSYKGGNAFKRLIERR